ncbi:permease prefix domain 1-containing protein [Bacillus sp. PS06]|uniref:permease prefix domain 1-containing protein n=1 Tax=Bacillus sp. PS06 TaxID=2764176 RepID=UPI0017838364|nr:DUF1129 family protein [Bacillus sp. PS06]MBD8069032.1 DUF1129 family protein [Bacillus sp. PS06]
MIQSKKDYINDLSKELKSHPNCEELLQEIDSHISEMIEELCLNQSLDEQAAIKEVQTKFGTPKEVAGTYHQELEVTPTKTQWTFILMNSLFFIGGIILTVLYHLLPIPMISHTWSFLTGIPIIIMLLYMGFWALLGYEIGKEFGFGGMKLLVRTFYISLLPNLFLMVLVLFRIVPTSWFDPLLSPAFIAACIVGTIVLYPISYVSFRWGTVKSI